MKSLFLTIIFILTLTGCNGKVLLPYEDEPLCKKGPKEGMCGSVSEVYSYSAKVNYGE